MFNTDSLCQIYSTIEATLTFWCLYSDSVMFMSPPGSTHFLEQKSSKVHSTTSYSNTIPWINKPLALK